MSSDTPPFASRLAPTIEFCTSADIGRLSGRHRWQASSHNGILVHPQDIGRLSGRHRWQASSHSGILYIRKILVGCQAVIAGRPAPTVGSVYIRKKLVGCQAVIAGRPAPTVESCTSARNWSAVRPPSQASQLLQLNRVHQQESGRLSGRHRWQASSHSGICVHPQDLGRLSGRHRWQASSHNRSVYTLRSSPLNRPSVSSPALLILIYPPRSGG